MSKGIPAITPHLVHKESEIDVLVRNPVLLLPSIISSDLITPDECHWLVHSGLYDENAREGCLASTMPPLEEWDEFCPLPQADLEPAWRGEMGSRDFRPGAEISYPLVFGEHSGLSIAIRYEVNNHANHYYFYNKEHDHVPGLMLIEIARQAMYHYFYSQYSHRRGEVSISMNALTAEFDAYVESCFPLTVIVNQPQPAYIAEPRHPAAIASFFQRGSRVGKISLHSSVLKNGIYEKIRKFEPPDGDWFLPFPDSPRAVMAELANGNVADLTIDSLSRAGIRLKNDIKVEADAVRRVVLYGKNIGYIPLPILGGQFLAEGILELRLAHWNDSTIVSSGNSSGDIATCPGNPHPEQPRGIIARGRYPTSCPRFFPQLVPIVRTWLCLTLVRRQLGDRRRRSGWPRRKTGRPFHSL